MCTADVLYSNLTVDEPIDTGWTSRVEAVLEYFKIPHTLEIHKLSEVRLNCSGIVRSYVHISTSSKHFLTKYLGQDYLAYWIRANYRMSIAREYQDLRFTRHL